MNPIAARTLGLAAVSLSAAAIIVSIATTAAGDVRHCKSIDRRVLTSAERTALASLIGAHWPGALTTVDGATFKRLGSNVTGVIVGCYPGSDAQIAAKLAGGAEVTNGVICDRIDPWFLTAGEKTTLGTVISAFHPTLSDVEAFHAVRGNGTIEGWAIVGETLTDAQALTAAKSTTGLKPGCN